MKRAAVLFGSVLFWVDAQATNWTYQDKTITDGNWTIKTDAFDATNPTIKLKGISSAAQSGVLDLRDLVVNDVVITNLLFSSSSGIWASVKVRKFYANHVGGETIPSMLKGNTTIEEIEFASETISETIKKDGMVIPSFSGCTALGRVVLNCPRLKAWSGGSNTLWSETVVSNAFHEIVERGVTNVGVCAFQDLWRTTGEICLTNLEEIAREVFGEHDWDGITRIRIWTKQADEFILPRGVKSVELGGGLKEILKPMVAGGALTNLVLDCPGLTNVCEGAFQMVDGGVVKICGRPFDERVMAKVLSCVAGNGERIILRVRRTRGWDRYAADFDEDFLSSQAPKGCFGVLREGTRGAWLVDDEFGKGTCIRIR